MQHLSQNLRGSSVLITGGNGYIGRIATIMFKQWGCTVWRLDDLSGSQAPSDTTHFIHGSILDATLLSTLFQRHKFDVVIHLAGKINVGESIERPEYYWLHNVRGTETLLSCMPPNTILLFASSAAVYGTNTDRVNENSPCTPTSPYGNGKLAAEQAILKHAQNSICFRLFNVAGAITHPSNHDIIIGEEHIPETHLIPRVIQQHLMGETFSIFGNTHSTNDGTCIREFVHVSDVIRAFAMGIIHLKTKQNHTPLTFNVTSGIGHSVLEILQAISKEGILFDQSPIQYFFGPARKGDPSRIAGAISHIQNTLQWNPVHSDISSIIRSTWQHQLSLNATKKDTRTIRV